MKRTLFPIFSLLLTSVMLLQNAFSKVYTLERTLSGHTENVLSVAFCPDGKVLASGSDDKTARLWNPMTGQLLSTLTTNNMYQVRSVSFNPKGQTLAWGSGDICLWDVAKATDDDLTTQPLAPENANALWCFSLFYAQRKGACKCQWESGAFVECSDWRAAKYPKRTFGTCLISLISVPMGRHLSPRVGASLL